MAATLALVFRTRLRLLPLALALAAAAMTFGALSLAGGSLTMASIAVLPVLIGLAVDYAIQFQARFDEQRARGRATPRARRPTAAARRAAHDRHGRRRHRGRLPGAAALAGPDGARLRRCCSCSASRWRSCCAVCAGFAALVRFGGGPARRRRRRCRGCARGSPRSARTRAWPARARGSPTAPGGRSASRWRARAGCWRSGWRWRWSGLALDTQSEVVSDVRELVPQDLQALRDVNELQEETGVSGEIDVTVRADDITDPR